MNIDSSIVGVEEEEDWSASALTRLLIRFSLLRVDVHHGHWQSMRFVASATNQVVEPVYGCYGPDLIDEAFPAM